MKWLICIRQKLKIEVQIRLVLLLALCIIGVKAVESRKRKLTKLCCFSVRLTFCLFHHSQTAEFFYWVKVMKPKKLVYGVGINDADYVVQKHETIGYVDGKQKRKRVWVCPYYETWVDMLRRCYSAKAQERNPTYKGCTVSEEWHTFSNFKSWMEKQQWEGKSLDKDLLFRGNKVYSADTCVFVTQMVNTFTIDCRAARGKWLIGVDWHKLAGKFRATISNPFNKKNEYLGYFTCELEAHNAWHKRKLELAHELAAIQTDPRVAKALIDRYSKQYVEDQAP